MLKEITDNIYCLELPMTHSPMGSVNCYIVKGENRSLLIDAGYNSDAGYSLLMQSLKQLCIDPKTLDIFLTHAHTDHIGLCDRIITPETTVYISKEEFLLSQKSSALQYWQEIEKYFQRNGWPEEDEYSFVGAYAGRLAQKFVLGGKIVYVRDGEMLPLAGKTFKVLSTAGHSKGHLSLLELGSRLLFVGDTLIENFYPILYYREDNVDMFNCYLHSIEKIRAANAQVLLTGHKQAIYQIDASCDKALKHYHKIQTTVMENLIYQSNDAYAITRKICRKSWDGFELRKKWFYMANVLTYLESFACNQTAHKSYCEGKVIFAYAGENDKACRF